MKPWRRAMETVAVTGVWAYRIRQADGTILPGIGTQDMLFGNREECRRYALQIGGTVIYPTNTGLPLAVGGQYFGGQIEDGE
jgi:hypothetical protein